MFSIFAKTFMTATRTQQETTLRELPKLKAFPCELPFGVPAGVRKP